MSTAIASSRSRNLVVVRAGDRSLHGAWLEGAAAGHYDLIVSYFGSDASRYRSPLEHRVDYRGGKWDGIHAVFTADPSLLERYDYFWLPDDDIAADSATVAGLFRLMREHDLALAQPSLTHDSYFSYLIFLQCPSFRLRYTNVVEVMVPCLRRDVLENVLPFFRETRSGFGLDFIWARLLSNNDRKAAILDSITVRHTRPVGGELHRKLAQIGASPHEEQRALLDRFGIRRPKMLVYEGISREGEVLRSRAQLAFRMGRDYLRAQPHAVQRNWLKHLVRIVRRHLIHRPELERVPVPSVARWARSG